MVLNQVIAVIDCGTNTFNLLVTRLEPDGKVTKLLSDRIAVRLGENGINAGFISEAPYQRGLKALEQFAAQLKELKAQTVLTFATSAIRDAANGLDFARDAKETCGIDLQIIDGNREAELIYFGNAAALDLGQKTALIMDIGGGSNEFILCNKHQIFWKQSFRVGAARLLELFPHQNPISAAQQASITDYLNEQLQPLLVAAKQYIPTQLVGSSGAFDSIVEMIHAELGGEALSAEKTGYSVSMRDYQSIAKKVINSTLDERKKIKGLVPMRVDMMVISCLMINQILNALKINKLQVSTYSLKEGALYNYIHTNTSQHG